MSKLSSTANQLKSASGAQMCLPRVVGPAGTHLDVQDRFWTKVAIVVDCWEWHAHKNSAGYGQFWFEGRDVLAHRFSYELMVGPIPQGLQIDHLCRNRVCVNPDHLEPVTPLVNTRRGIRVTSPTCIHGHERSPENVGVDRHGYRYCRPCGADRKRAYKAQRKAAA